MQMDRSIDCLVQGCNFADWTDEATGYGLRMTGGQFNHVDGNLFREVVGGLFVATDELDPLISNNLNADGDTANAVYTFDNPRSNKITFVNNQGVYLADPDDLVTYVADRIKCAGQAREMLFEDSNTAAGASANDAIGLASASHREFDGATNNVITDAVNERLLKAGGAMSGNLAMGANILTDGTTRNIGADGAGNRFAAFLASLDIDGNIVTDGTTRDVGAAGAAGGRFDVFANALDILGAVKHGSRTIWIPASAGMINETDESIYYTSDFNGTAGKIGSITTGGVVLVDYPISAFLRAGDTIDTLTVFGLEGNLAGEQLIAKLWKMNSINVSTQLSVTKTSGTSGLNTSIGWTSADVEIPYMLTVDNMLLLTCSMPQTSDPVEAAIYGIKIEYSRV